MSTFPVPQESTIRSGSLPGAYLELVQRAFDKLAFAPLGTQIAFNFSQTRASVALAIPATEFFPAATGILPATRAILSYSDGSEVASADVPAAWKLKVPDRAGTGVIETNYSNALIVGSFLLKEAERLFPPTQGSGITAIAYNDVTRLFALQASLPIDPNPVSSGRIQIDPIDYLGNATWVNLLASAN